MESYRTTTNAGGSKSSQTGAAANVNVPLDPVQSDAPPSPADPLAAAD
jgi:hypothetical protein